LSDAECAAAGKYGRKPGAGKIKPSKAGYAKRAKVKLQP